MKTLQKKQNICLHFYSPICQQPSLEKGSDHLIVRRRIDMQCILCHNQLIRTIFEGRPVYCCPSPFIFIKIEDTYMIISNQTGIKEHMKRNSSTSFLVLLHFYYFLVLQESLITVVHILVRRLTIGPSNNKVMLHDI